MTPYPKEEIGSLSELNRSDSRIKTPPERSPGDVRHDVVQGRRLIIGIDKVLDQRYPKSINNKSIQKRISLQKNGVQMRDRPQGMT